MNFLSHFYFEHPPQNAYQACGMVLPDLVKNANKAWNLHPQKSSSLFESKTTLNNLLKGWDRHLKVDVIFHQAPFFLNHTANLKQALIPLLKDSPIRPSFMAHISLELLLDHLLTRENKIQIPDFYTTLESVDHAELNDFLQLAGLANTEQFFKFFEQFIASRYLFSYQKLENISYALRRICMRVWPQDFPESRLVLLTACLHEYLKVLESDYMLIFEEIDTELQTK